jgi:CO/xanthine dehydrogenase Mo-binding subunit
MTYSTSRVQHVHLETHGSIAWRGDDGRMHVRTSSQAPFIAQLKLCHLFGLNARDVHVFTERVGGGFGGKQEMISEDLCVLATLKTGRPVKWEFTREEQFIGASTRHQMTTRVKLGAKRDGTLTAIEIDVVSNTGAYGGHAGETLAAALGSPLTAYRCKNKKAIGYAVYTNMVPGGGFRGYGASQTTFAIECAIDELAKLIGMEPFAIRRKNMVARGTGSSRSGRTPRISGSAATGSTNASILLKGRSPPEAATPKPDGADWRRARASRWRCWIAARRPSTAPERAWDAGRRHLSPRGRLDRDGQRIGNLAPADRRLDPRRAGGCDRHHQRRHRPDALRHRHVRQHRHRRRRSGGGAGRRRAARQHPRFCQSPHRRCHRRLPSR